MEDACYTNFRPREERQQHNPIFQWQAASNFFFTKEPNYGKIQRETTKSQCLLPRRPRWHRLAVEIGCAAVLIAAVIALGLFVCVNGKLLLEALQIKQALHAQEKACASQGSNNGTQWETKTVLENPPSENCQPLRRLLCKLHGNGSTENSQCRLCQENWLLHEDKCYWTSKEKQNWNQSRQDCTGKNSKIVVIQGQEELDFIQSITDGAQLLWIGLTTSSPAGEWTWLDGSPLNSTLLQVMGTVQANSCGMLKGNRVVSEACSAVTKWICETEALLV